MYILYIHKGSQRSEDTLNHNQLGYFLKIRFIHKRATSMAAFPLSETGYSYKYR